MSSFEPANEPSGVAQRAGQAARATAEKVRTTAAEATTRARETAAEFAGEQRDQAADRLSNYGSALEDAAESTRAQDPNIAWLTEQAAARLQQAAEYVRTCDWNRLRSDGADLARRHPVAFYSGMFLLGAVAGAVVKAGARGMAGADTPDFAEADSDREGGADYATAAASAAIPETF